MRSYHDLEGQVCTDMQLTQFVHLNYKVMIKQPFMSSFYFITIIVNLVS